MRYEDTPSGLGGWLVLVGIGVIFSPMRIIHLLGTLHWPLISDGSWAAISTPGLASYNPMLSALIAGEIAFNLAMLALSLYLIYLFFTKHHRFPALFILLAATPLVFIPLDAWLASLALPGQPTFDPDAASELGRSAIGALIWIPYMLRSRRVKATFVRREPAESAESASTLPLPSPD